MRDLFQLESPLMMFLSRLTDLIILNVICLLCCIPVVTGGASLTALHYVTLKMAKNEEGYIVKSFFKSFKENFKQATVMWILFLMVTFVYVLDLRILEYGGIELPKIVKPILMMTYFLCLITAMYAFPVLSRFSNSIRTTIKNSFLMSIIHVGKTLVMVIIYAIPVLLVPVNFNFIAIYLLFGLSAPAMINSYIWKSIFVKYEPVNEEETICTDSEEIFVESVHGE